MLSSPQTARQAALQECLRGVGIYTLVSDTPVDTRDGSELLNVYPHQRRVSAPLGRAVHAVCLFGAASGPCSVIKQAAFWGKGVGPVRGQSKLSGTIALRDVHVLIDK